VLALMALLPEALDDEPDGSIRAVARAFAWRVARIAWRSRWKRASRGRRH
jgi:hypothetical protein